MSNAEEILQIIDDGLLVEDKAIKLYSSILKNSDFIKTIPVESKEKINSYLDILINESSKHERFLNEIKTQL